MHKNIFFSQKVTKNKIQRFEKDQTCKYQKKFWCRPETGCYALNWQVYFLKRICKKKVQTIFKLHN